MISSFKSKSKLFECVCVFIILLPLLWLNVRHSQHWGDDFALYIQQAINISEGKSFDFTTYQYVPGFCSIIPSAPAGFSLLLIPIYKIFGLNIYPYSIYLAVIYCLWALVAYAVFRKEFGVFVACLALLVSFYANFMLWLKLLITSDVPFSLFLLCGCWLVVNKLSQSIKWTILAAMCFAFAIVTRSAGIAIIPALILYFADQRFLQKENQTKNISRLVVLLILPVVVYIAFNSLLFPPQYRYENYSLQVFDVSRLPLTLLNNIQAHGLNYMKLFRSTDADLKNVSVFFSWIALLLTLGGFVLRFLKNRSFYEWIVVAYLGLILIYPVQADYRYIAPVHPLLIFYLFYCVKKIAEFASVNYKWLAAALGIAIIYLYNDHLQYLRHTTHEIVPGPYEEICQETFTYLKNNFPESETMVFNKPRALALFTGKKTTYFNCDSSANYNLAVLKKEKVKYYLFSNQLAEQDYKNILELNANAMKEIYKNWQFTLYLDTTVNSVRQ